MINNKKTYNKVLLLVIAIVAILGTQVLAATLTKVTDLTSRVTNNTATLTWNKVANVTGYEIQVKVAGRQYETIGKVTRTNVNIKGVTTGTTYYARVRAYKIINGRTAYGEYSNEIRLQASNSNNNNNNNVSLGQVTNLTVNNITGTQATLAWNRVNNATSYEIYVKVGNGSYQSLGAVQSNSVRINNLQARTTYAVKVRALNGQKAGNFSKEVSFTVNSNNNNVNLGQVTNLKLNSITETQANLSWNRVEDATSYEIYVKIGNGNYQSIGTISNTNVRINNLQAGTTYAVKVRALNGQKAGNFSSEITFKTSSNNNNVTTLGKVTNLKSSNIEKTQANFTWNKVSSAAGYEIYLKGTNGSYEYLGKVGNNNVRINNLQEGTLYSIKVRAYLTQNGRTIYGDYSDVLNFTTKSDNNNNNNNNQTVAKVTNLTANINGRDATLTWNTISGVTGYEVQINVGGTGYTSLGTTYKNYTTVNSLRTGTMYYAKVRAYKTINGQTIYGEYSDEIKISVSNSGTTETLSKVAGVNVTNISATSANVEWNRMQDAEGYEIYIDKAGNGYNLVGITNKTTTTINNLTAGTGYTLKIRAYKTINNQKIYGEYSDEIGFKTTTQVTPPAEKLGKVTNLNANVTGLEARLTWNNVSNADGYEIYVNIPGAGYRSLGTTSSNNVRVVGLAANTTYYAKVRAYKVVNGQTIYGEFSDETNFAATNGSQTQVSRVTNLRGTVTGTEATLTWNTVSGATKYEIFIDIPGIGYKSLGTTTSNNVRVVNLVQGTTYKVKVRAIGTRNGNVVYGDYSDEINLMAR